jgi:hypothetical protein
MEEARRQKVKDRHSVIDDAIKDRGEGYTVFSIPVGVLYSPSDSKLRSTKKKDFMGQPVSVSNLLIHRYSCPIAITVEVMVIHSIVT